MTHLLEVKDLTTEFTNDFGKHTPVDHISFYIKEGEVLSFVGESGCGKSVTSLSILGLLEKGGTVTGGSAFFDGKDLLSLSEKEKNKIRGKEIAMIYQDPMTSLNPSFTIGSQMIELIRTHTKMTKKEAKALAITMLKKAGLNDAENLLKRYPHTLSGGMCQRVMIAMALSCGPKLLIADEPTTALDVTIQAQIMQLLKDLQKEMGMAMILITHDMGLVAQMADRVAVMYAGQIVEEAPVDELFAHPVHPYTKALLNTIPSVRDDGSRVLLSIPGRVPERYDNIKGCRFAKRCTYRCEKCEEPQEDYFFESNKYEGKSTDSSTDIKKAGKYPDFVADSEETGNSIDFSDDIKGADERTDITEEKHIVKCIVMKERGMTR